MRRKNFIAAMAATLPACGESLATVPMKIGPLHMECHTKTTTVVMDMPLHHMFLPAYASTMLATSSGRYGGRGTTTTPRIEQDDEKENDYRVLGFDTGLWMVPSGGDPLKWNSAEYTNPIKNQVAASLFRKREDTCTPAWFPWIPTKSQIEVLKLAELKAACDDRGLTKTGKKSDLELRLWEWAQQQHRQRVAERRGEATVGMGLGLSDMYPKSTARPKAEPKPRPSSEPKLQANSLAEWSRNVDHLLTRREAIHREKLQGKTPPPKEAPLPPPAPKDYRKYLTKAFEAPSSLYSNRDVKEMYKASKLADQAGDREAAFALLRQLKEATPADSRVLRRLARMESEDGRVDEARAILQDGLRLLPQNGYLWQGLGQLELNSGAFKEARRCFREAIRVDPALPNPYHALGTLEHTHGRIALATNVVKKGIEYCPKNHRLHHALGDLYREARMLTDAERSYRKALEYGPTVSHGFAYTALAFVAYEQGHIDDCRNWLHKSVSLNDGRHSQGWVALAQMEESEGHVSAALGACIGAISKYEHGLLSRNDKYNNRHKGKPKEMPIDQNVDPQAMKETLFKMVPQYRSGDKFISVYRNWARLEEKHGTAEGVDEVYTRASVAFPYDWKLYVNWAQYHVGKHHDEKARELFAKACKKVKNRHADPYRMYAEFEMSAGKYKSAQSILLGGAQAMSSSSDGGLGNKAGISELFHTWAVCEWHLDNLSRAEVLFDHALRMTDAGENGSKFRSFIFYSIARLEYCRGEHELAQHCIALCLKENVMPGGNSKIWELWADVASAMGNDKLVKQCEEQVVVLRQEEKDNGVEALSRLLSVSNPCAATGGLANLVGAASQPLMRREPWHDKIFGQKTCVSSGFFRGVKLPEKRFIVDNEPAMPSDGASIDQLNSLKSQEIETAGLPSMGEM